jgi:prophage antirepressor-like protein
MTENSLIMFKCEDQEFPMEIIDQKGDSWVTRKQLAEALGVKDLDPLHRRLSERGELKDSIHWNTCTVDSTAQVNGNTVTQKREVVIYSYRGIIRVAMASEGKRAVAFRDWAEDVLYEVMVRGSYSRKDYSYADELDRRTKAIRSELKALKADNAFRMQAEREALKVRRGGKSLDDLNGYPNLREKVSKLVEKPMPDKDFMRESPLASYIPKFFEITGKSKDFLGFSDILEHLNKNNISLLPNEQTSAAVKKALMGTGVSYGFGGNPKTGRKCRGYKGIIRLLKNI